MKMALYKSKIVGQTYVYFFRIQNTWSNGSKKQKESILLYIKAKVSQ